jgi:hypothetical protein
MPSNRKKADALVAQFDRKYRDLAKRVANTAYVNFQNGMNEADAVRAAFKIHNVESWMLTNITNGVIRSAIYGYGYIPSFALLSNKGLTSKILANSYDGSAVEFSRRVHQNVEQAKKVVLQTVKRTMRAGQAVQDATLKLYEGYGYGQAIPLDVDISKQLRTVAVKEVERIRELRRMGISVSKSGEISSGIRKAERIAKSMSRSNLKTSYSELVEAVKKSNEKAILNSLQTAMEEKARAHAMLIAQTEMSRAYGQAFESRSVHDPDVAGIKYSLSTGHVMFDICDVHTSVDFGLGKGVYPLNKLPPYPFHPRCMCRMIEVFTGEIPEDYKLTEKKVDKNMTAYLNDLSEKKQVALLGSEGAKQFTEDGKWQGNLRNWNGHRKAVATIASKAFTQSHL